MAILIDDPLWTHRGRKWCHMVSDVSHEELVSFADAVGIPRRGFQGDHYDIPEEYRDDMVAAGAVEVGSRELLRRMKAAGLRLSAADRRRFFAERDAAPVAVGADVRDAAVPETMEVGHGR